jgi:hypothetical protein
MPLNAGVWIDHKRAVVVLISPLGEEVKKIGSGIVKHPWPVGAPRERNSYTPNDFTAEDRLERKRAYQLSAFYDEVIAYIGAAEAVLILGPGEAKGEFKKRIDSKQHQGLISELATVDKMTDRQIAARVREHFSTRGTTANETRPA